MGPRSEPLGRPPGSPPGRGPRHAGCAPDIQTRLAWSFGLTILVTGLAVVVALWVVVGASLLGRPPALTVVPSAVILHALEPGPPGQQDEPLATDALGLEIAPYSLRSFSPSDFDRLWVDAAGRRLATLSGFAGLAVVLVAASSGYLLSRRVSAPLSRFAETVQELSSSSLDRRVPDPGTDDELGLLAASFNAMLDRLEASFQDLEGATAYVSHELRTALTVVRTQLEVGLAGSRDLGLAARQALAATVRASNMVDDALALAARSVPGTAEPVDLALVAAQAVDDYSRPGRQLTLEIPADGVPPVRGNSTWMYRAVANLLDNAFKHGPELGPVTVRVIPRFDAVVLSVEDHGPGIAAEDLDRIWKRFYRGNGQGSGDGRGYGLGLALVRQAVESAGGAVWVETEQGRGSAFCLSVPLL
ncbi:MAG: HAMP domain-containing sensor histidine kinase [Bacillota bacterium]|nr:HAMP domain-containing sensor histidine kinase [Bacillota bacterium]